MKRLPEAEQLIDEAPDNVSDDKDMDSELEAKTDDEVREKEQDIDGEIGKA